MLNYPDINPIAIKVGPLAVHWYGIMYLIGFIGGWWVLRLNIRRKKLPWTSEQLADLLFYVALGVVLGGRAGYVLFYNFWFYVSHPLQIFTLSSGGMSFHGGFLGVMLALALYSHKYGRSFFELTDFTLPVVPIGLGAGRIGNFINGELWGKVAEWPWAMRLPCADPRFLSYCNHVAVGYSQPRQPSQLYEALLEGLVLFTVLNWFNSKPRPRGAVSGLFVLLYGFFRFGVEFVRLPDSQLGYLAWGWLTMGQLLSIPLILVGGVVLLLAYRMSGAKKLKSYSRI